MSHIAAPVDSVVLAFDDVELRPVTADDAPLLAELLEAGIVPAGCEQWLPNLFRARGAAGSAAARAASTVAYYANVAASRTVDDWQIPFAVRHRGVLVGCQEAKAHKFAVIGDVHTGSWLSLAEQGQGTGSIMRALVVEWAFAHLGAAHVSSGFEDSNVASSGVSAKLGYEPNGCFFDEFDGRCWRYQRLLLRRERWTRFRPGWLDDASISVPAGALEQLGADRRHTTD